MAFLCTALIGFGVADSIQSAAGCSGTTKGDADPTVTLSPRIRPADPTVLARRMAREDWPNPRILIDVTGIYIQTRTDKGLDHAIPNERLAQALAALPRKAWRWGRVAALTMSARAQQLVDDHRDGSAVVEKTRRDVRTILEAMGIRI